MYVLNEMGDVYETHEIKIIKVKGEGEGREGGEAERVLLLVLALLNRPVFGMICVQSMI